MSKKLATNTILYVLLGFLSPALNFLLLPIYTRTLTKLDFSIIAMSMLIQGLFKNLIGGGIIGAYVRFHFEYKKSNEIASLFFTSIVAILAGLGIWLFVMFLSGDLLFSIIFKNEEFTFSKYGWISLALAALMNVIQLVLNKYRNEENVKMYALIAVSSFLLPAALIYVGVVVLNGGALYSLYGRLAGVGLVIGVYVMVFAITQSYSFRKKYLTDMFSYSRNIMFYLMLTFLFTNLDRYMIERNFDFTDLGMYGLAISVVSVVEIFVFAMNNAFKPRIYTIWKLEDSAENRQKVRNISRFIIIGLSLIWFGLLLLFPFINQFVLNNLYPNLNYLFPLMILTMIWRIYYIVYAEPVFFHMHTGILPKSTMFCLIFSLLMQFALIPFFGIVGVIIVTSLTAMAQLLIVILYSREKNILPSDVFFFPKEYALYFYGIIVAISMSLIYHNYSLNNAHFVTLCLILLTLIVFFTLYRKELQAFVSVMKSSSKNISRG